MKCVLLAINVCLCEMLFLTYAQNTLQPRRLLMKLTIMTIKFKLKVLIKFGVSEMMCEIESQKATKYVPFDVNVSIILCEMLFLACTKHTSTTLPVNETQYYDY